MRRLKVILKRGCLLRVLILILIIALIIHYLSSGQPKVNKIYTVAATESADLLYYPGIIEPLNTRVISSPADGVVIEMPQQYGSQVKVNDVLFVLSSTKFLNDYKAALMQFVKAKNDFNLSEVQLKESEFLHKKELISTDEFHAKQSNYYAARLSLLQARDNLEVYLQQLNQDDKDLYQLTIADADKIIQKIHTQMRTEAIRILSPENGILLSPIKTTEETKKVTQGDFVKQGALLAMIGDMSGINIKIRVNELVVNQLKSGQPVQITGLAFPQLVLTGMIHSIDRQGESSSNGLPTFLVEVVVPNLTIEQQQFIHVGMSANVSIRQSNDKNIQIPLVAIEEKRGKSYVNLLDANKRVQRVAVLTGKTSQNAVVILAGLKQGDKIVYPD